MTYTTPGYESNGEMISEGRFMAPVPTFGMPIWGESMVESSALEADGVAGLVTTIVMGPTGQGATYAWAQPRGSRSTPISRTGSPPPSS